MTSGRVLMCGHPCQCLGLEPVTLATCVQPVAAQGKMYGHLCVSLVEVRWFSLPVRLFAINTI
jgi:hypothetical protein